MDRRYLVHRGRLPTSLPRFLIRITLHCPIGIVHRRWSKQLKPLPFLITLTSAFYPLFLSPRRIPDGKTSTTPLLEPTHKALLVLPPTPRFATLPPRSTSLRAGRKEKSDREDAIVRRTLRIGTYERAWKMGIVSGHACGLNLLTARQTLHRPRTFADTRHRSRTPDNMSRVVISNYGTSIYSRLVVIFPAPTTETHAIVARISNSARSAWTVRPYTCPECGRTWRDQGARYNHRVREHGYVPKKPKRWLFEDATLEGGTSSDNSHLNVSFVMESVGQ